MIRIRPRKTPIIKVKNQTTASVMTATEEVQEALTEEPIEAEAEDHKRVITIKAIKMTAIMACRSRTDHTSMVTEQEACQGVVQEDQTTEGATRHTMNLPQQAENPEAKEQLIKEIGDLVEAGISGGGAEAQTDEST